MLQPWSWPPTGLPSAATMTRCRPELSPT